MNSRFLGEYLDMLTTTTKRRFGFSEHLLAKSELRHIIRLPVKKSSDNVKKIMLLEIILTKSTRKLV